MATVAREKDEADETDRAHRSLKAMGIEDGERGTDGGGDRRSNTDSDVGSSPLTSSSGVSDRDAAVRGVAAHTSGEGAVQPRGDGQLRTVQGFSDVVERQGGDEDEEKLQKEPFYTSVASTASSPLSHGKALAQEQASVAAPTGSAATRTMQLSLGEDGKGSATATAPARAHRLLCLHPIAMSEQEGHEIPQPKRLRLSLHAPATVTALATFAEQQEGVMRSADADAPNDGHSGRRVLRLAPPTTVGTAAASLALSIKAAGSLRKVDHEVHQRSACGVKAVSEEEGPSALSPLHEKALRGDGATGASADVTSPRPPPILSASAPLSVSQPNVASPLVVNPPTATSQQRSASNVAAASPSYASKESCGFPRLRSLTPTPYPGGPSAACRRHRFAGVNLPAAPPPSIDFGCIERVVKDFYEVQEKLSEGTYGEVFKGVDKRSGALVALKRLKMLNTHQGFPQTSLREVIALRHIQAQRERIEARLRGESTSGRQGGDGATDPLAEVSQLCDVLLYDRGRRDIVLVFAYATASLAGLCRRQFAFAPSELAYVMKRLLIAVRKLHEMRIIHRDIKSDNVLVTSDGEVQLTDFGLCSIARNSATATGGRTWRTPSVITLAYRPPEMLLGSTAYDEKVDIWSFGCLLAQMYLFEPPFLRHRPSAPQQQQPPRTAATELEQLSRITEVLGPLPPAQVYHPDACQHLKALEQLEKQGKLAEVGAAPQPPNWGKLQSLFEPSFLYQQFHGFRGWFEAELQRSRHQPHRRPTQACMDVLCATLQLDPQQRPSAAELLRMPYFLTLDDAPLLGSYVRLLPVTPEREDEVRRGFMIKVQRCGDSHTQRRPHQ